MVVSVKPGRAAAWTGKKTWKMASLRIEDMSSGHVYLFKGQNGGWFRLKQWERGWDRVEGSLGLVLEEEFAGTDVMGVLTKVC